DSRRSVGNSTVVLDKNLKCVFWD
ncbi:hypothetical protein CP082626L3_0340B, partial [Chlamydia psittaci 08-2626_L3]